MTEFADKRLDGRVAVITGAGDGIGHGIARRFAREGARIVVAEIDETNGAKVAAELASEFGGHLGAVGLQRVDRMPDSAMEHAWHMNVMGPMWAMKESFPHMRAAGRGRVINICSLNGVNAHMGSVHYNTTKEALRTLTRTAAREWAAFGITANVICPGAKTASFRMFEAANPEMAVASEAAIPMGHLGDPEGDIAPVAFFLASDDSVYITGNTLYADGGSHINGAVWVPDLGD